MTQRRSAPAGALQGHAKFLLRCGRGSSAFLTALLICGCRMMGDDFVFDLVIGGLGNDLLSHEIALGVVWAAINDLLAVRIADSGKRSEIFLAGSVDVNQVSFLGLS